jgi:hypothetical protein
MPSATHSTRSIQLPRFSSSRPNRDRPCAVVSLPLYRAQRRRATIAAQAAARRRTVICLALCLLGLIAGAVTLEREIHLQRVEVSR